MKEEARAGVSRACTHAFLTRGPRTGGVFTVMCEHAVCYSFFVMPGAEGRNELYSWIMKHMVKAPELVVYDFACSLHAYCLNRAPQFFSNTLFLVDRFYWGNHASCSHAYDITRFAQYDSLKTEVCEQLNNALRKIKSTVTQMSLGSFMAFARLFFEMWNKERSDRVLQAMRHQELLQAA